MTDDIAGVDCEAIPVPLGLPGWWGKVAAFAPMWKDRVIFFDLDTVILDSIDFLAETKAPFAALRPFYRKNGIASGLMSIAPEFRRDIWQRFAVDPEAAIARCREQAVPPWNDGDQRWLELMDAQPVYWQSINPGKMVSWKVHCVDGIPKDTAIVLFHGKPDPHEVTHPLIRKNWKPG